MYVYQQLSLQWIALISAGCVCSGIMYTIFGGSSRLLAKWPFVVIIGSAYWLNTSLPLQAEISAASLLTLVYWLALKPWDPWVNRKLRREWLVMGALLPLALPVAIHLEPNVIYYYYKNIWLTLGIAVLLTGTLLFFAFRHKNFKPLLYGMPLLAFATFIHFEVTELLTTQLFIGLALFESISAFKLLSNLRAEMKKTLDKHKDIETTFEKQVELEVKKRTFYMELTKERMAEINRTDHLTKLLNRKSMLADIEDLILSRQVNMFALFVFDIDHFKQINDSLGHATGDVCLKNLAAVVKSQLSDDDFAGRYGGDEFMIALPNKGFKEGLLFARNLMAEINKQTSPEFSISVGMAVYPWDGETYKRLFEVADKGLYAAKEAGRKRLGYKGYIKPTTGDFNTED